MGLYLEGRPNNDRVVCEVALDARKVGTLTVTLSEWDRLKEISARLNMIGWFSVRALEDQ